MAFAWYSYDAFLSHAVEDKVEIADELCRRLRENNLRIWYSGDGLKTGTDISSQVHAAIRKSRSGIFVLSTKFIEKEWTKREYYLMKSRDGRDETIIFPIFLHLNPGDVARMDPNLVDIYGLNIAKGPDAIAAKIAGVIKAKKIRRHFRRGVWACIVAIALSVIGTITYTKAITDRRLLIETTSKSKILKSVELTPINHTSLQPPSTLVESAIAHRLIEFEAALQEEHPITTDHEKSINIEEVQVFLGQFQNDKSRFRNEFDFNDGTVTTRSKKNVERVIGFDPSTIVPGNKYLFKAAYLREAKGNAAQGVTYMLKAKEPAEWTIYKPAINGIPYIIKVNYGNRVRMANVFLTYSLSNNDTRYNRVHLFGLPIEEHFEFVQSNGIWTLGKVY